MDNNAKPDRFCLDCDYPIHTTLEPACPECGRRFDPADPSTYATSLHRMPRWLTAAVVLLSTYPVVMVMSLYSTWIVAWILLGHRPRSSLDDPQGISNLGDILYEVTWKLMEYAVPAWILSVLLIPTLLIMYCCMQRRLGRPIFVLAAISAFLWIASYVLLRSDPGYVLYWYFD